MATLRGHRDLRVYQLAYKLAMEIFSESKSFPENERYSLTSQIRRSSRSVAAFCRLPLAAPHEAVSPEIRVSEPSGDFAPTVDTHGDGL